MFRARDGWFEGKILYFNTQIHVYHILFTDRTSDYVAAEDFDGIYLILLQHFFWASELVHSVHSMLICVYGDDRYDSKTSKSIILASINFICSSERFGGQFTWWRKHYICFHCLDFSICLIISMNQIMRSRLSVSLYENF